MKKIIVFASGSKQGGGSGFRELVENSLTGILNAEISAVCSNYPNGGVRNLSNKFGIPFVYFKGPWTAARYQSIVDFHEVDFVVLSGWLKLVKGLDPQKTINIHPGPLPRFGGDGYYGHYVHQAVIEAFCRGEVTQSVVSMHFVTEKYDEGPVFFQYPILIRSDDTAESLAKRVNKIEHGWQSWVTNLVINGEIYWDGKDPESLVVPSWYSFHKNFKER